MSIIHTCRLSKVDPFDYIVALQKHTHELFKKPGKRLTWNCHPEAARLST